MLINQLSHCLLKPKLKLAVFTYFAFLFPFHTYKKSFRIKFWTRNKNADFEYIECLSMCQTPCWSSLGSPLAPREARKASHLWLLATLSCLCSTYLTELILIAKINYCSNLKKKKVKLIFHCIRISHEWNNILAALLWLHCIGSGSWWGKRSY